LGSVREVVDATGTLRARYDYDAWGNRTKLSGDVEADFGFTGPSTTNKPALSSPTTAPMTPDSADGYPEIPLLKMGGLTCMGMSPIIRSMFLTPWGFQISAPLEGMISWATLSLKRLLLSRISQTPLLD
jgi:hypothetical protein